MKKNLLINLFSLISGLLFGIGLIHSGMANPEVVQSFLDVMGAWDPALAWVMIGALAVSIVGVMIAKRRGRTFLDTPLHIPTNTPIDRRLIIGGLIFGAGWGLVGICPAPALVLVGQGIWQGILFVAAMLVGMKLVNLWQCRQLEKSLNQ